MLSISRLVGAFTAGRALYTSGNFFHQLTCQITKIVILALGAVFTLCALLIGVIYAVYRLLVSCGLSSDTALLVIGLVLLLKLIIMFLLLVQQVKNIKDLPQQVMQQQSPLSYRLHNMADAFIKGFNAKKY